MQAGKVFYQRFLLIFMALAVAPVLTGCGKDGADASSEYSVVLEGAGNRPAEDMISVLKDRRLTIEGQDGSREIPWVSKTHQMAQFEVGDDLVFNAYRSDNTVAVTGRARVGNEKRITIVIRSLLN